jgi:hypothetical protein
LKFQSGTSSPTHGGRRPLRVSASPREPLCNVRQDDRMGRIYRNLRLTNSNLPLLQLQTSNFKLNTEH